MIVLKVNLELKGDIKGNDLALLNKVLSEKKLSLETLSMLLGEGIYDADYNIQHVEEKQEIAHLRGWVSPVTDKTHIDEVPHSRLIEITVR